MPSKTVAVGLGLLVLSHAYVQLDFQKRRVGVAELHPTIRSRYLARDLNRVKRAGTVTATLDNAQNNLLYLVNVTVGSNKQEMALQLDTGSSDIWVPDASSDICQSSDDLCSNGAYSSSSSSSFTDIAQGEFEISYVDGTDIQGDYFQDTFGIGGSSVSNQIMGLATRANIQSTSQPFQGIIGVGFPSGESWVAEGGEQYPNIISSLKSQGHTTTMAYSLWLNDLEAQTGSILFGGVDTSRYTGDLIILPVQPDSQSGTLTSFTVVLDSMNVAAGNGKVQYSQSNMALPVILDSGTTMTYLPDEIAGAIASGVGAGSDTSGGLYVPCDLMNSPATFNFRFGNSNGPTIQVQINEFVIPYPEQQDGLTPKLQDGTEICQWGILEAGSNPILFGDTFLRSAYVVYDIQDKKVGIAQTKFNVSSSDSDIQEITNSQLPGASSTASGAEVTQTATGSPNDPQTQGSAETATENLGTEATATFDLSGSSTGGAGSVGAASSSRGAAAGPPMPATSTIVGALSIAIIAVSSLSGALMVLL